MIPHILCFEGEPAWSEGSAAWVAARLGAAVAEQGRATLCLAGGSTPKLLYHALAQVEGIPWEQVHFFWGDERCVPPEHDESNFRMAREALLEPLGLAADAPTVHRFPTEASSPRENAALYEQNLRLFFKLAPAEMPRFDVLLLGMGADGHTASLFPGTVALEEREHLAVANEVPDKGARLTLTFPVLDAARSLLVLVRGPDKAARVAEALRTQNTGSSTLPIQRLTPQGEAAWALDTEAAALLPPGMCEGTERITA